MTQQTGFTQSAIRPAVVLLLLGLFSTGPAVTFATQIVNNFDGCHISEAGISQASLKDENLVSSCTYRDTASRRITFLSVRSSQMQKNRRKMLVNIRGGSTIHRKKSNQLIERNEDEVSKEIDLSQKIGSTATQSPRSVSAPNSTRAPSPSSNLAVLLSSSFITLLSSTLVAFSPAPALIAEIGSERATSMLSTIAACAALTEIIISPAFGSLLDSIGRKPALVLTTSCISFVHGLVALHSSAFTICAAKFVGMVCFSSFITTSQVVVSDISESNPERMSSIFGRTYALYGCAFFVGSILAGKLSELGLSMTYGASTVVAALSAALISFGMEETLPSSRRVPFQENKTLLKKQLLQSPLTSCTRILFRHTKEVRILAILMMLQSLPIHMNETFQILVKTEWNIDTKDFSSFVAMIGVINICANLVGSRMVTKLGIKYFTAVATLSSTMAPLGASFFSFRGLVIGTIIGFLASSQMLGVTAALFGEGAKSNVPQGELAGERSSFIALVKVIGPIWYSFLFVAGKKVLGTGFLPFLFNAGCGLTAFGISQRYLPS